MTEPRFEFGRKGGGIVFHRDGVMVFRVRGEVAVSRALLGQPFLLPIEIEGIGIPVLVIDGIPIEDVSEKRGVRPPGCPGEDSTCALGEMGERKGGTRVGGGVCRGIKGKKVENRSREIAAVLGAFEPSRLSAGSEVLRDVSQCIQPVRVAGTVIRDRQRSEEGDRIVEQVGPPHRRRRPAGGPLPSTRLPAGSGWRVSGCGHRPSKHRPRMYRRISAEVLLGLPHWGRRFPRF
ncbi:MAG: hypothetical protein MZV64_30465 [Ignavibacteriales bacterium]|nr:hypothetical protein [Ignavibacteriales bacterium]